MKIALCAVMLLLISCSNERQQAPGNIIDVVSAMQEIGEIKASDYFQNVRCIPLETTDSCLIGKSPSILLFQDRILVNTMQKQCFLFDKQTGKFIRQIGHIGNDPGGYSSVDCWVDEKAGLIYFPGWNKQLVCYDLEGNYTGTVNPPKTSDATISYNYLGGDTLIGFCHNMTGEEKNRIAFFRKNGELIDILPNEQTSNTSFGMDQIGEVAVLNGETAASLFTPAASKGVIIISGKEPETGSITFLGGNTNFWHLDNKTYFKETFNDTIFRIEGTRLVADKILNLGEYHWPYEERYSKKYGKKIFITQLLENDRLLMFRFIIGLFGNESSKQYNAAYNKSTGELKISELNKGLTDDLTNFIPFQPLTVSGKGEFAGLILPEEIHEWLDKKEGNGKIPEPISRLKNIKEDDNPVIIVMD